MTALPAAACEHLPVVVLSGEASINTEFYNQAIAL